MTLAYLMDEICAGLEIYYTGRIGTQYFKTAFILCDDYTELVSKLYLLSVDPKWSEIDSEAASEVKMAEGELKKALKYEDPKSTIIDKKHIETLLKGVSGRFKNYHKILEDVQEKYEKRNPDKELDTLKTIHSNMQRRRNRRNDFFHSTTLLDLSVNQRICVEAYCDLLDYGLLLFGEEWIKELGSCRNLDLLEILIRLERKGFSDPSVMSKVNRLLSLVPKNSTSTLPKLGVQIAYPPEDLYYRLCFISGGQELKKGLVSLL